MPWLDAGAGHGAGVATLQRATLVFAHAAPDTRVLAGLECPAQALGGHRAAVAHELRVSDLSDGRAAVSHAEEQFRILVATDRLVAPIHGQHSSLGAQQSAQCFFTSAVNGCTRNVSALLHLMFSQAGQMSIAAR